MSQDTGSDLRLDDVQSQDKGQITSQSTTSINEILATLQMQAVEQHVKDSFTLSQKHRTEAKTALYTLIADKVVGEDEPVKKVEGLAVFKIKMIRNQLKAGQRKILKELFDA